jgi:hypothetical protein
VERGVFVDAPVSGLSYRTQTRSGTTDRTGAFEYVNGETITFFIGGMDLPSAPARPHMTPLDLAKTNSLEDSTLINLLVLLQSLDDDADPSNGIEIPRAVTAAANGLISLSLDPAAFAAQPQLLDLAARRTVGGANIVPQGRAVSHFLTAVNGAGAIPRINVAPQARAGASQSILVGAAVTLNGTGSVDPNGDSLTYAWTLASKPAGSAAVLEGATGARPSFRADVAGAYVATLVVSDGRSSSGVATVTVTAADGNVVPVAEAGVDQTVLVNATVTLDGRASSDANGDALSYSWTLATKPAGSSATLIGANRAQPTFAADRAGTYVASLTVSDGKASSAVDLVTIVAEVGNAAPVANAGAAQTVAPGSTVTLNGTASTDANGDPLAYTWAFVSRPAGSTATLAGTNTAQPTFRADVVGTYVATLTVNDGKVASSASTVSVTASLAIQGGYPTVQLDCAVGTPMKFERPWTVNYNGGTIRLTPQGESEQVAIWEVSNITTQQHSGSATFSAPTTDGRQAWLTVSNAGQIIGGGVHGKTSDSYVRCGVARDGVAYSGIESVRLSCKSGYYLTPDGQITSPTNQPNTLVVFDSDPVTIRYDVTKWPFVRIESSTASYPSISFAPDNPSIFIGRFDSIGGRPATVIYLSGGSPFGPTYYLQDGRIIGYVERTIRAYPPNCGVTQ